MANYDEKVSFQQGSDTGTAESTSIVPISDAEVVWSGSTNRPIENLRQRTEILRRAVQDTRYYLDYDRGLILRSEGLFSLEEVPAGSTKFRLRATAPLWVYPSLTPGQGCGGRWGGGRVFKDNNPYLFGTTAADGLSLTASAAFTGQRGYADGDTMATATVLSVGANRITVDFVDDATLATGVFQYVISQMPATKITIRYGTISGAPSFAALIANLNAATPVNTMLHAATAAASPSSLYISPLTGLVVQGAYDAEAHQVTVGQFDAFFDATTGGVQTNLLINGEGLAIGFPVGPVETYTSPYPKGGRRQSIFDLPTSRTGSPVSADNTTPVSGYSLFNTGYEPEKIPGAVPIGKLVRILLTPGVYATEFVFIDGTRVRFGADPVALGESTYTRTRLASSTGVTGASLVGYGGSGNWNPTALLAPTALPSGTVEEALDNIVLQLGGVSTNVGGARRIGFENLPGEASAGNRPLNLLGTDTDPTSGQIVKSVQIAIARMLNKGGGVGGPGGVNARVSEFGHRLHGPEPLEKLFWETGPTTLVGGGAQMIRAELNPATNARLEGQVEEQAISLLKPFRWSDGSTTVGLDLPVLPDTSPVNRLKLTTLNLNAATLLQQELALVSGDAPLHCVVRLTKTDGDALDGYYFATVVNAGATPPTVLLVSRNGATPDLTTIGSAARLTFLQSALFGNDAQGDLSRYTVGLASKGAAMAFFGDGQVHRGYNREGVYCYYATVREGVWEYRNITTNAVTSGSTATSTTGALASLGMLRITGLGGVMTSASVGRWLRITATASGFEALIGLWEIAALIDTSTVDILVTDPSITTATGLVWAERRDRARRTPNILIREDAQYLRGVELGTLRDASPNHHHDSLYQFKPTLPVGSAYSTNDPGAIPTAGSSGFTLNALGSGVQPRAVVVQIKVTLVAAAAGDCFVHLRLGPDVANESAEVYMRFGADSIGQTLVWSGQATIPLDVAANRYKIWRVTVTNVDTGSTSVDVREIAQLGDAH